MTVRAGKKSATGAAKNGVQKSGMEQSLEMALLAARTAAENKGQNLLVLNVREKAAIFDYFVVVTGRSGRQLRAIADEIERVLAEELDEHRIRTEGYRESRWIVMDYGNVVIQIFNESAREFYRLEELWDDVPRVDLTATLNSVRS